MFVKLPSKALIVIVAMVVVVSLSGCDWFLPPVPPEAADLVIRDISMLASRMSQITPPPPNDKSAVDFAYEAALLPMDAFTFTDIALGKWTPESPLTFVNGPYTITWTTSLDTFQWTFFYDAEGGYDVRIVAAKTATGWLMVIQKDQVDFVRAEISADGSNGEATFTVDNGADFLFVWGTPGGASFEMFYDLVLYGLDGQPDYTLDIDASKDAFAGSYKYENKVDPRDNLTGFWPLS